MTTRAVALRVTEVIPETTDACSLVFEVPAEQAVTFNYRPGQFLTLRIPSDVTGSVARCYSLASSPHSDECPKVTVKRTAAGYGSNWLCDNITPGDIVEVLPPAGMFTPDNLDADLLLLAAGSGITPIISIVKSALAVGHGRVALLYANRDADSVIFAGELRVLQERHPVRLTVTHWLESEHGSTPTARQLADMAGEYTDFQAYLCGPGAFLDTARAALELLDVPRTRIHTEVFSSLQGDPFVTPEPVAAQGGNASEAAMVDVELDGTTHTLSWPPTRSLVDIMLDEGLDVPYSCQEGQCGSCMCTLVEGEVSMDNPEILDPADIEDGYILGCQAHPLTDRVHIRF